MNLLLNYPSEGGRGGRGGGRRRGGRRRRRSGGKRRRKEPAAEGGELFCKIIKKSVFIEAEQIYTHALYYFPTLYMFDT